MTNKFMEAASKVLKVVGACIVTAAVTEVGYLGGRMLGNDIEYTADAINDKINPIEMRKPHWWSKPQPFNVRKNQFVADLEKKSKN